MLPDVCSCFVKVDLTQDKPKDVYFMPKRDNIFSSINAKHDINVRVCNVEVKDVAEKIGSCFGEKGKEIGKAIDDVTKDVTLVLFGK